MDQLTTLWMPKGRQLTVLAPETTVELGLVNTDGRLWVSIRSRHRYSVLTMLGRDI